MTADMTSKTPRLRTASWRFEPDSGALWRHGSAPAKSPSGRSLPTEDAPLRLEPRVADLLTFLGARPGEVIDKETLRREVWDGRHVTDDALHVAISSLRRAFDDSPKAPRWLETVPRRGYRWIGPALETDVPRTVGGVPEELVHHEPVDTGHDPWVRRAVGCLVGFAALGTIGALFVRMPDGIPGLGDPLRPFVIHLPADEDIPDRARVAVEEGRHLAAAGDEASLRKALDSFTEATALAPDWAPAYAGLADVYVLMADAGLAPPHELYPAARANADRALELDPWQAQPHVALGGIHLFFDHDIAAAEASFTTALELDPESADAHERLAWLRLAQGRFDDAAASARDAIQLDPTSLPRRLTLSTSLYYGEDADALERAARDALRLDVDFCAAIRHLGLAELLRDRPDEAYAAFRGELVCRRSSVEELARFDEAYAIDGLAGVWRLRGERLLERDTSLALAAAYFAYAGDAERALALLEESARAREPLLLVARVDPGFESLRGDPRFERIVADLPLID